MAMEILYTHLATEEVTLSHKFNNVTALNLGTGVHTHTSHDTHNNTLCDIPLKLNTEYFCKAGAYKRHRLIDSLHPIIG